MPNSKHTATDKLRKLLDERGKKWVEFIEPTATAWTDGTHGIVADENDDDKLWLTMSMMTPEQAVAMTLGYRELTAEQVRECVKTIYFEGYNDGSVGRGPHIEETDWQWITNKLNAKLECETCHNTQTDFDFQCSECGKCLDNGRTLGIKYCPYCGAKVVS